MTAALGNVTQYVGRLVDLLAFQGQQPSGDTLLSQELLADNRGGEICTGVQKLAQRWLLEFLTVTGSLLYLPLRGCDFVGQLRQGQLRTTLDVQQAFYLAVQQIQVNLLAEDSMTSAPDEVLGSVALDGVVISGDALTITVTILSSAGTSAELILPIDVRNG